MVMANPSLPPIKLHSHDTMLAAIKQEPRQSPPFLHPPIPIATPLATVKTEPDQPEQQQTLQSPPSLPPPIPIPPPLATVKIEPDQPEQHQPLQSPPRLPPQKTIPPPLATVITEPNQPEQQQPQEPQLVKSINDLASHAAAVLAFKSKFDELTKHLDFINQAIDSKFNEPLQEEQHPQIEPQPCLKSKQTEAETVQKAPETAPPPESLCGEIQSYCLKMNGKLVRKYIVKHLSNLPMLREEIPAALKLAPEPAKLVLDSVGEMILMGKKAYTNVPSNSQVRRAIHLLLEIFLLMMSGESRVKIGAYVKVVAQNRAVALRKRLNKEGGLSNATADDARSLLLYVACFGIPNVFTNWDLGILLKLCNLRSISDAIKASPWLPGKMPDIIRSMAKNGMHFEALEVASIFELEDEFSPKTILTLFLQESTKAFERGKQEAHNLPVELRKTKEKRLDSLKSVVRYLEDCTSNAMELLGSWLIKEKIMKLEEEIAELDKRIVKKKKHPKRKPDKMGSSSSTVKSQEVKRSRLDTQGPALPKSHVNQVHEQQTAILTEDGDLVPNSCNANNYPVASSAPHGSCFSFPGNGPVQIGGTTGVESSSIGVIPSSSESGADDLFPNSCKANNYPVASSAPHGSTCSFPGNGSGKIEGTTGVESSGIGVIPASYSGVDGADQMLSGSGLRSGWPQHSNVQMQSASTWFVGLFGSSLSVEGFVGLPDKSVRTLADLYRFADT